MTFCSTVSRNTGKLQSLELSDFFDIFSLFPFKIACWMFGRYLCANKKCFQCSCSEDMSKLEREASSGWKYPSSLPWVHGVVVCTKTERNQHHVQKHPLGPVYLCRKKKKKVCSLGSDDSSEPKREVWGLVPTHFPSRFFPISKAWYVANHRGNRSSSSSEALWWHSVHRKRTFTF